MQENQRITLTKRLLKEGLLRLLQKKDIEKISVSELCVESGINRATFYRHYQIPLDVLKDIQQDFINEADLFPKEPKSLQDMADQFERICKYLKEHENVMKTLFRCSTDKDFADVLESYCKKFLDAKYGNVLDKDSIRLIVHGLAGGAYGVMKTWLLEDVQKTPKEMGELLVRFISFGSKRI